MERRHLAQAERHIAQARGHIARQQQIIDQLTIAGRPIADAEATLATFQASLRAFERHRVLILDRLASE